VSSRGRRPAENVASARDILPWTAAVNSKVPRPAVSAVASARDRPRWTVVLTAKALPRPRPAVVTTAKVRPPMTDPHPLKADNASHRP